jgi:hypothetical protein
VTKRLVVAAREDEERDLGGADDAVRAGEKQRQIVERLRNA